MTNMKANYGPNSTFKLEIWSARAETFRKLPYCRHRPYSRDYTFYSISVPAVFHIWIMYFL